MLKRNTILVIILSFLIIFVISCTPTMLLIGVWVNEEGSYKTTLELNDDDTFVMTGENTDSSTSISIPGTWEADSVSLKLMVNIDGEINTESFNYSLNGNELTLTSEDESKIYIKQ